jgi:hypothetical protein
MNMTMFQSINKNISLAWAKAYLISLDIGVRKISPLTISVLGCPEQNYRFCEDQVIRNGLDDALIKNGKFQSHTTANTIFPIALWNPGMDSRVLYNRYKHILPELKRADSANRYGLYFERMVSYGNANRNQLEFVINTYKNGNHRPSALQIAIYDPLVDQTNQLRRGFPCLQQVAFIPDGVTGTLSIHGFYAMQYIFDRAYGNLLGLVRLGEFMAFQMGLRLSKVSTTAAVAMYGDLPKRELISLTDLVQQVIKTYREDD